jgi:bleomycin hydrolase
MDISTFNVSSLDNNNAMDNAYHYSLHNNLLSSVSTPRHTTQVPSVFTKEITPPVKSSNQKSSGRCWIFAALNMLRRSLIEEKKLPESFEFSQSYVFFYDKLERMNYNLKLVEDMGAQNREWDDRVVNHILKEPFGDGGQWVMFTNIANKYGIVPKDAYPESTHSSKSAGVNMVLSRMFRTFVKDFYNNQDYSRKKCLEKTYEVLVRFFGEPPKNFVWNYKSGKNVETFNGTPHNFMTEFCNINFNDYVSLTHDPRNEYNRLYGVEHLGNVEGGDDVKYLNVNINRMVELTKRAIDDNIPVWFGSDVGQFFNSKLAILDENSFDYNGYLGLNDTMNKKERILFGESLMTHAMVYSGYNIDPYGSINYWKIENSWGTEGPYGGSLICSDRWFREYTYQLIVPKKYITESECNVWNGDISHSFPIWDPMGSLAN